MFTCHSVAGSFLLEKLWRQSICSRSENQFSNHAKQRTFDLGDFFNLLFLIFLSFVAIDVNRKATHLGLLPKFISWSNKGPLNL